ncbi:MAG TPA: FGGY family carbohydrate kinase [Glaciibacter sp.]|nr:FGGY family carbohydrate kinase [Glaciibacter sp.]
MSPASHRADPPHASGAALIALGIDVGTTNTKAVVIAVDAISGIDSVHELSMRSFPTPAGAAAILEGLEEAIRGALADAGAQPTVVGIASMAETGVPLASGGAPLRELIRWNGQDATLGTQILANHLDPEDLFVATGVPLAPKVPLAMWAGLRTRDPALWSRMAAWAGVADYVGLALTGELVTDHTLAGRTMAYRLPPAGQALAGSFDSGLLDVVGLRPEQLPRVAVPGDAAGTVTAAAARRFGIAPGIPVYIAGHDHAVGAWAAGAREAGDAADSVGTAEALVRILGDGVDRRAVANAGMSLTRSAGGVRESLLAGTPHAGSLVAEWFRTTLAGSDRDTVFGEVSTLGYDPGGVLVLPYPTGRQTPAPDPHARLEIVDAQGRPVDPTAYSAAQLTRGLLVGLNLHVRWMAAEQARLAAGGVPATIRVLGGAGAGNAAWMTFKAAIMPAVLELVSVREPVASGAALLAATRAGLVDADVRLPSTLVPRPFGVSPSDAGFDAAYATFVAAAAGAHLRKGIQ